MFIYSIQTLFVSAEQSAGSSDRALDVRHEISGREIFFSTHVPVQELGSGFGLGFILGFGFGLWFGLGVRVKG